jgi:hypothetical protein
MFESGKEKPEPSYSEIAKKVFLNFEARSDDPGEFLSGEEKDKLQEATLTDPDAQRKWEENKNSKYRVNSLYSPLMASDNFLRSPEAGSIPEKHKEELIKKVDKAYADLGESRGKKISKELVDEITDIMNEVKKFLK